MPLIGVRELRQRTAEVLRLVREQRAEYIITHQGRPAALLLPLDPHLAEAAMVEAGKQAIAGGWETYARLADEIRAAWPPDRGSLEILDQVRR